MPPPPKPAHLKKKNADPPKSREEENPSVNHVSETIIQQSSEPVRKPLNPSRKPSEPKEMSRPTSSIHKGAPRTKAVPPSEEDACLNEKESEIEEAVFPSTENEMTAPFSPPLVRKKPT